jgi:hypothetical protein
MLKNWTYILVTNMYSVYEFVVGFYLGNNGWGIDSYSLLQSVFSANWPKWMTIEQIHLGHSALKAIWVVFCQIVLTCKFTLIVKYLIKNLRHIVKLFAIKMPIFSNYKSIGSFLQVFKPKRFQS